MDIHDLLNYTQQNLASWDEAAPLHAGINQHLLQEVSRADYSNLDPHLTDLMDEVDITGLSCVQICCNNGIDLISLKKKGAGNCLGIDGSPAFIKQAQELAELAGLKEISFVRHNIYELPAGYQGQFDVALITVGVLNWMPDLTRFMKVCASLLKPGGRLIMEEIHPILSMYVEGEPSHIGASYFDKTPYEDENGLDYFNATQYKAKKNFWFNHSLSEILMSALNAGLQLQHIEELAENIGNYCADLEQAENNPPLGFTAVWNKRD
ncbi:SAM-dependent methyltransferase [Hahella sp. CCB-MM4]|uniref:class I SAM-dependent methyltransferase n=1 Tax=Hahella sp. (strain CCB-MM4) TaxID=1926491 RepID=UPI000B9A7603|nr:class I SAM-dependent methyltransferase [Hahella sp. CCB-MM4]OZG72426.1 SAM-dependent methyltransferase [Hahella sp. CCB-MM4]